MSMHLSLRRHFHSYDVMGHRFFLYLLIMGLVNQTSITIFRATAAIGRAVVLCNVVAFIYIAYSLMLCGFIITYGEPPQVPQLNCPPMSRMSFPSSVNMQAC